MDRKIILTGDGSHTISIPSMGVTYHSIHGALQESQYVFIDAGLRKIMDLQAQTGADPADSTHILEMGFGTGLNALLTLIESASHNLVIDYTALDLWPLDTEQALGLNYCQCLHQPGYQPLFEKLHTCPWGESVNLSTQFTLRKIQSDLLGFSEPRMYDLVYFDAFAPGAQAELWTRSIFDKLYAMVKSGGILVTYCSKGDVRRAMQAAGFSVEKLKGPPHKREMLRAQKNNY